MHAGREAVGRYQVMAELGTGGFATVYRGHDPVLGREVALKVLHPHLARDAEFRERFVREGRALARVRHPNVVQVHDAGEVDGTAFLAMEFVEGRPLDEVVAGAPLSFRELLSVARQVAPALAAVHAAGLLHRDIKPANIIVTPGADGGRIGRAVLLDLGISREMGATGLTATGSVLGTPGFLAPEQAGPGQSGPATDVYQLAATFYALLAGRAPFEGDTARVLWALLHQPPPAVELFCPDVPGHAAAAIMRALAKDPAQRPNGPRALLEALEQAPAAPPAPPPPIAQPFQGPPPVAAPLSLQEAATVQRFAPSAPPASPPSPPPPERRRGSVLVVGGVGVLGAAVVALVIATSGDGRSAATGRPRPRATTVVTTPLATPGTLVRTASPARTVITTAVVRTASPNATAVRTVTPVASTTRPTASATVTRMSLPTTPAPQVPIVASLSQQEREVLTLLNGFGPAYASAVRGPDVAPLREVCTGEALAQYTKTVQDLQAAGQYHVTGVVTISLTAFALEGPDGATASTKEVWRTSTHDKASGRRLSGATTTYEESYRFVRRDGRWLISENPYRAVEQTTN